MVSVWLVPKSVEQTVHPFTPMAGSVTVSASATPLNKVRAAAKIRNLENFMFVPFAGRFSCSEALISGFCDTDPARPGPLPI